MREMTLVAVANGSRDVRDGDTAKQQLATVPYSHGFQVRVRRQPDLFLKGPGKIERAEVDDCSQFRERAVRIIVRVDLYSRALRTADRSLSPRQRERRSSAKRPITSARASIRW